MKLPIIAMLATAPADIILGLVRRELGPDVITWPLIIAFGFALGIVFIGGVFAAEKIKSARE